LPVQRGEGRLSIIESMQTTKSNPPNKVQRKKDHKQQQGKGKGKGIHTI